MGAELPLRMTPEEFFRWGERQEGHYELVGGRVVMMVRVTRAHLRVAMRIAKLLIDSLDERPIRYSQGEFGVRTPAGIRYPDIVVDRWTGNGQELATSEPLFVAEVLCPYSLSIDMIEKTAEYKSLPSLQAYLVASQDEPIVWLWQRGADGWPGAPEMIEGRGQLVALAGLGVALPLERIYPGIGSDAGRAPEPSS